MRLLIVEDDRRLADVLRRNFSELGTIVEICSDGVQAETIAREGNFDVILLDIMLPGQNGIALTTALRAAGHTTPILILTARDAVADIVAGLDAGADDYVCKPFELIELEARVRAVARRSQINLGKIQSAGGIELDLATGLARRGERMIRLTARELSFLRLFLTNVNQILSREQIESALWDVHRELGASNVIDVYVARLRAKLSIDDEEQVIHTVRGLGYRFGAPSA